MLSQGGFGSGASASRVDTGARIPRHTNRLIGAASPYLLQHAHNPVDCFPWGEEAFARAKEEDKPIFLSIGYAACHWCHVMERESFEDSAVAAFLNEHFVPIKVDREERPDVDEIYMTAVQLTTGSGGWPLSLFLTPDLRPFYGGTYFPPEERWGKPGFGRLLEMLAGAWKSRRGEIDRIAGQLSSGIRRADGATREVEPARAQIGRAAEIVAAGFDPHWGGFGSAPKFPPTGQCELLLREWRRSGRDEFLSMVEKTLTRMACGGIFDQLGGGFARYSTDVEWLVPHFEKMLYDNALLTVNYLDLHAATGKSEYAETARRTLDWALREMRDPAGGFHSSLDADSEGVEGKFYVWKADEIRSILGADEGRLFCELFGVAEGGNFEHGESILHLARPLPAVAEEFNLPPDEMTARMEAARRRLLAARSSRIPPAKDDKVLADWNGLMIAALARASRVLREQSYLDAAQEAALFLKNNLYREGKLYHSWRDGVIGAEALLDDYAFLIAALIELYQADFDPRWIEWALDLAAELVEGFYDPEGGGFYMTRSGASDLIHRPKLFRDGATPSGNAVAAKGLMELSLLTDRDEYQRLSLRSFRIFGASVAENPTMHLRSAVAMALTLEAPATLVIAGDPNDALARKLREVCDSGYYPGLLVAGGEPEGIISLLSNKPPASGKPTAYLCINGTCRSPITDAGELRMALEALYSNRSEEGVQ